MAVQSHKLYEDLSSVFFDFLQLGVVSMSGSLARIAWIVRIGHTIACKRASRLGKILYDYYIRY